MTRTGECTDMISAMDAKGPRVTIEFEADAGAQMAGTLVDQHGVGVQFNGWLGLASGLERILTPARKHEATADDRREAAG